MATPLFPCLINSLDHDLEKGKFHPYQKGWFLPCVDLKKGTKVYKTSTFLTSFLTGEFIEHEGELVGYYFTSKFKTRQSDAFLLGFPNSKSGMSKACNRVFNNDVLVILEYPNCGTLALSPTVSDSILTILEEQ